MRKAISIFLPLLFIVAMVALPTGAISAQTAPTTQLTPPSPAAMQAGEKELIDDILTELDQARKLTTDKDTINQIGIIRDWVKKIPALSEGGDTKAALEIKYTIAKRLEWLINRLPLATPGATAAVAAMPAQNPLYDELVRIRAKIDKLIELEEREIPTITPYEPPEIQRPPEMEKLIIYSAKFLCGPALGGEGVQQGSYSTAINVHNPHNDTVYLFKKAVIAEREDEPRGKISKFRKVVLGPDEAIEIDCIDIVRLFGTEQETGVTVPSQQTQTLLQTTAVRPIEAPIRFIKGFVVIYATAPLDVVGVYTASTSAGFSLDVEQIPRSTTGVLPIPIPEEPEGEVCPQGCVCLTNLQASKKFGPGGAAKCLEKECGWDTDPQTGERVPMYCWKPTPITYPECPDKCNCVTQAEIGEHPEYRPCIDNSGNKIICGRDQADKEMYCMQRTGTTYPECPTGCACLTKDDAYKRYGQNVTQCQEQPCGKDASGNPMYCWKSGEAAKCPQGCECLALAAVPAGQKGYVQCGGKEVLCGRDQYGNPSYCYQKAECLQGCQCISEVEAKRLGYTYCQNQRMQCGVDASGAAKYCFQKPISTEVKPVPGRILIDPAQDRNPVGSQHTITVVVSDTNGKPMANVRVKISHTGANPFAPIELTTDANGKTSYYYTGKNAGIDTIVATVDNLSAKATKEWYTPITPPTRLQ